MTSTILPVDLLCADGPRAAGEAARAFSSLRRFGDRPALLSTDGALTFADVADRVEESPLASGTRRLVAIAGVNTTETLLTYVAAMAHGHVVLLVPGDNPAAAASIVDGYDPDVVHDQDGLHLRRGDSVHELHLDLALLMSTSGSTGSPKLVRLSGRNVVSNAEAIAEYLGIDADDRAITTLPLHYCYGLSVVNSHLLSGASVVTTQWSVVDPCLWDLLDASQVTSLAGVPYTFDLLDRTGFAERDHPSLRRVTVAGGPLAPDRVVHHARLGRERGWSFVPMYGQTEATARMAYLPSSLVETHPHALGVPIPGGSFRLEPVPEAEDAEGEVGELVYSGPNVMLGYAEKPADLANGRETRELRTGDLARLGEDGMYEWVGRRSRFAKIFGLRLDLDEIERVLAGQGIAARCVGEGDQIQVFVERKRDIGPARSAVTSRCGLPAHAVDVIHATKLPRTSSGKVDYAALRRHASHPSGSVRAPIPARLVDIEGIRSLYAELLGRPDATPDDSFQSLRGDSLSYVEVSVRLAELPVDLPEDWHRMTVRELVARPVRRRRTVALETSVGLRAVAIMLILGTHANLFTVPGGAHLLLVLVGFNLFRFRDPQEPPRRRIRRGLAGVANVAAPSMLWIGLVAVTTGYYSIWTVLFMNGTVGSDGWTAQWQFWFLEAVVWTQLSVVAITSLPIIDRALRRAPFAMAMGAVVGALALRFALTGVEAEPTERYTPSMLLWCFAIGWAGWAARTHGQRLLVSAAILVAVPGFFDDPRRETVVVVGALLLVWTSTVRVSTPVARGAGAVAAASLFIYLTHWQVYPHLENRVPVLAVLASLAVGIAVHRAYVAGSRGMRSTVARKAAGRGPAVPTTLHI